jgi:hypothetical protein
LGKDLSIGVVCGLFYLRGAVPTLRISRRSSLKNKAIGALRQLSQTEIHRNFHGA